MSVIVLFLGCFRLVTRFCHVAGMAGLAQQTSRTIVGTTLLST